MDAPQKSLENILFNEELGDVTSLLLTMASWSSKTKSAFNDLEYDKKAIIDIMIRETNQVILELGECFDKLQQFRQSNADSSHLEAEIQQRIDFVKSNYNRLDILVQKEPVQRRQNAKIKVDQIKYDISHFQNGFQRYQTDRTRRLNEKRERDELLSHRFTQNRNPDDITILIDHSVQHQNSLKNSNQQIDHILDAGYAVLNDLKSQGNRLEGVRSKLLNFGNTLRLSNTTMRLIEKIVREDKYILIGGMVITVLFLLLIIIYVR